MKYNTSRILSIIFFGGLVLTSCQKEINGEPGTGMVNTKQKPKVGTTWTYNYYVFNQNGGLHTSEIIIHRAKAEVILGGEKWLQIVDLAADTTVYLLNEKPGGLYQYTNNSSNLLCKFPATVNDSYITFNEGSTENFTVKAVNDTLPTGIGNVPANYYEGVKGLYLIDLIWYNEYGWIVRKTQYRNRSAIGEIGRAHV